VTERARRGTSPATLDFDLVVEGTACQVTDPPVVAAMAARWAAADTGMLTALHVLAAVGEQRQKLSELAARFTRYVASGEINSQVTDVPAKLDEVEAAYTKPGVTTERLDGLTVSLGDGRWFNLRPSNTEPLLRLNVEAPDHDVMTAVRDEVLALVR